MEQRVCSLVRTRSLVVHAMLFGLAFFREESRSGASFWVRVQHPVFPSFKGCNFDLTAPATMKTNMEALEDETTAASGWTVWFSTILPCCVGRVSIVCRCATHHPSHFIFFVAIAIAINQHTLYLFRSTFRAALHSNNLKQYFIRPTPNKKKSAIWLGAPRLNVHIVLRNFHRTSHSLQTLCFVKRIDEIGLIGQPGIILATT